jgi:hypothetical protein
MDTVKIKLWVPDQKALHEILSTAKVSLAAAQPPIAGCKPGFPF